MTDTITYTEPPADLPEIQRGNWFAVPVGDPVALHLESCAWVTAEPGCSWQAARLSKAAYLYQDIHTGWSVAIKYYGIKTGVEGPRHALREYELNQRAYMNWLVDPEHRAVKPLSVWDDVLFLEYIDGITLEDTVAIRKSQPGLLMKRLEQTATLLAHLHSSTDPARDHAHFSHWVGKTRKILHHLVKHGVLQDDPLIQRGLDALITRWEEKSWMDDFHPVPMHGDTTTSNFVYPWLGGIVAIDWERAGYADPAFDLGRLQAEIAHSIDHHGGDMAEAAAFGEYVREVYGKSLSSTDSLDALFKRARFYQASSSLRIARNGWVPREDRLRLVGQAFALLSE